MDYTKEERKIIDEAWHILERIVESSYDQEQCLRKSYKFEYKNRKDSHHCKLLILRAIYNRNKIPKQDIFHYSEGIMNCIIMAYNTFYKPYHNKVNIAKFNKLAKLAIEVQVKFMERRYADSGNE